MSEHIDLMELHAKRKYGLPDEWQVFRWVAKHPTFFELTGAVCKAVYSRGPRKGRPNWDKREKETEGTVSIIRTDHAAFLLAWEAETGKCHECQGSGQTMTSWSVAKGASYGKCRRCAGAGTPPVAGEG